MKPHALLIPATGLVAVALGVALDAALQHSTFSTGNRTVAVYATVTGAEGRLVPDLTSGDFEIADNGARQDLTLFANDIQPITVVMLLDRSGSMRGHFQLVEQAAEEFVKAMMPVDKARIGSFSNRVQVDPRRFTSDEGELLQILRSELQEEGPTPLWNAVNVGITALLHEDGRRVILVFTDGMDNPGNLGNNNSSLRDVLRRAEEENVMVYAIGLAGDNAAARGGFGGAGGPSRGHGGFGGGRFGQPPPGGASEKPDPGLAKIAAATGGGYFELTTTADLGATFSRVADELHHQYALGFAPAKLDDKMHALQVTVHAQGATVRARKSYLAGRTD